MALVLTRRHQPARDSPRPRRGQGGFTLVELLIVVVILGILAAVVIPQFGTFSIDAKVNQGYQDFRVFGKALQRYYVRNEAWPGDQGPDGFPPELAGYIAEAAWDRGPGIGDVWDWNPAWGPADLQPNIAVRAANPESDVWQALDDRFDDGNLGSGHIQRHQGNFLCYGVGN